MFEFDLKRMLYFFGAPSGEGLYLLLLKFIFSLVMIVIVRRKNAISKKYFRFY